MPTQHRKRQRTAWSAVSESRSRLIPPSCTMITPKNESYHVHVTNHLNPDKQQQQKQTTNNTTTPPTACVARSLLPAINSAATNQQLPTTPLVLRPQDVISAQIDLGLTPDTPDSAAPLYFLHPSDEAEARALLSSSRKMRVSSSASASQSPPIIDNLASNPIPQQRQDSEARPISLRRLSTGSAVTPIPLQLESPEKNHSNPYEISEGNPVKRPLFQADMQPTTLKPHLDSTKLYQVPSKQHHTPNALPSPITPAHTAQNLSLFKTASGKKVPLPPQNYNNNASSSTFTNALPTNPTPFNTTFVPFSDGRVDIPAASKVPPSHFKTASGRSISAPPLQQNPFTGFLTPAPGPSLFKTASGKPLPIPQNSTPMPASFMFFTGSGKKLSIPPANKKASTVSNSLASDGSLFKTASGKKIPIPPLNNDTLQDMRTPARNILNEKRTPRQQNKAVINTEGNANTHTPTFTNTNTKSPFYVKPATTTVTPPIFFTGKGNPVPVAPMTLLAQNMSSSGQDKTPGPMFTTAKGTPLAVPKSNQNLGFTTPSPVVPVFTNGKGTPLAPPSSDRQLCDILLPSATRTPGSDVRRPPKRVLPRETPPNAEFRKTDATPVSARTRSGQGGRTRGRGGRGNGGLKTTPFKRPRQVKRPRKSPSETREGKESRRVPKFPIPALLKNGGISCHGSKTHNCKSKDVKTLNTPSEFVKQVGCSRKCMEFQFSKDLFGDIECLPLDVVDELGIRDLATFNVENCVKWISRIFPPNVESKPATVVGSRIWTSMSYLLAVRKLALLDLIHSGDRAIKRNFLSAANVVRELLRRIQKEWHDQKQPHLLRIMRNDSSPASHVVLGVVDIEKRDSDNVFLVVTDGWYIARAIIDDALSKQVWRGKVRVGTKIRICGASSESLPQGIPFAFGDGDELGTSVIKININSMIRVPESQKSVRLGIRKRKGIVTKSLLRIQEGGGVHPGAEVILLRSFPTFYIEAKSSNENEDEKEFVYLRQDAEDEARETFREHMRRRLFESTEKKRRGSKQSSGDEEDVQIENRDVRPVQEIMICGVNDNPQHPKSRKMLRIYKPSDELLRIVQKEGIRLRIMQIHPKKNGWSCPSDLVSSISRIPRTTISPYSRTNCFISQVRDGAISTGDDFSGVYALIYVSEPNDHSNTRFAYFADDVENISVLALELSGQDALLLPQALRARPKLSPQFPLIGLRDIEYTNFNSDHDLVHAKATMRTSFYSESFFKRRAKKENNLKSQFFETQKNLVRGQVQLEFVRDAIIQFASGKRRSIGAYFTSTQDIEQTSA